MAAWRVFDTHSDRKRGISSAEAGTLRQQQRPNPASIRAALTGRSTAPPLPGGSTIAETSPLAVDQRTLLVAQDVSFGDVVVLDGTLLPVAAVHRANLTRRLGYRTCHAQRLAEEHLRASKVDRLRAMFAKALQAKGIRKPREAFNRWLFEQRARKPTRSHGGAAEGTGRAAASDPLIPQEAETSQGSLAIENELMTDAAALYPDPEERRAVIQSIRRRLAEDADAAAREVQRESTTKHDGDSGYK